MSSTKCRETIEWATLSLWLMDYGRSWRARIRCFVAFVCFTALFAVMWAEGDPARYTHPWFIVFTAVFIIYAQGSLLFRMKREGWL
ncbi:hypothetical protein QEA29_004212 [Salmonella enterica]|nr:hypothetical protein [Salmonella enterica subsp. enterica]EKT1261242.1 hypothetical protein [Salmonella enterica]EKT1325915.1 hypothetical protein [Salmonella enterica]EKT1359034.1 hypothetical protein [Salmonella enterica]EKT2634821.1 hypothetical protein [Salmonella enterica]